MNPYVGLQSMSIVLDLAICVQVSMDLLANAILNFAQLTISVQYTLIARCKLGLMALHWGLPHNAIFDQNVIFAKMTLLSQRSSSLRFQICVVSLVLLILAIQCTCLSHEFEMHLVGTCNPRCLPGLDFSVDTFFHVQWEL